MNKIEVILGLSHEGKTTKLINMFVEAMFIESKKSDIEKKALVFISSDETAFSITSNLIEKCHIPKSVATRLPIYNICQFSEIEPILLTYLKDNDVVLFLDEPQLLHRNTDRLYIPLHTKLEILCTKYPVNGYKSLDIIYTKSIVRK